MLGWSTLYEDIELTGGDWVFERTNAAGPFPADTTAEVKWKNGVTWPATVDGATVRWLVESEDCTPEDVPHETPFAIWVHYLNPLDPAKTIDYPWIRGSAYRTDRFDLED